MRGGTLALAVGQVVVLALIGWTLWDAHDAGAWWWAPASGEAAEPLLTIGPLVVQHTDAALILGTLEAGLVTFGAFYGLTRPPSDVARLQATLERREREVRLLRDEVAEARLEAQTIGTRLGEERAAYARIPEGLRRYYLDGHDQVSAEEVARVARRELNHWEALAHTFHTGAVAPLLGALRAVPEDHRSGIHHYSTHDVVTLLARVSQELRENDWLAKALRWAEAKYGT